MAKAVKQNKSKLDGYEELAQALMRCAGTGIYIIQDGRFRHVNSLFQELSGYTEEELLGLNPLDLVHPDDRETVRQKAIESLKCGRSFAYEYRFIKKDGGQIWVLERLSSTEYEGKRATVGSFMDITERKQSEQALAKSEARYRTIMDETHDDYFEVDMAGNYTFVNDSFCSGTRYDMEEMIGKSYRLTTASEDVERMYETFHQVYITGQPIRAFIFKFVRKDGSRGVGELSAFPIRNENGKIGGFRGVIHNVTERVRMEEALRQSEERYRNVLEGIEESYYEVDLTGNYTFFNNALCRQLGYSREELMGMNYRVYTPPENLKKVFQTFNQVYRTSEPLKLFNMEQIRKDGTRIVADPSVFPLRNEKGEIIGFRGVSRDVTERIHMEEALRQSEERYRTILAEIEEGYYEVDLAGNIKFVNRAACRQFGYSEEELVGSNYRVYVLKEDIKGVYKAWNKVYRTGEPLQSYPFATVRKDGTQMFVENSVSPLRNKEGTIIGFRAVSRDVTQRKQFEQKLAEMATHDTLTGLPNRALLSDRLTMGLAHTRRSGNKLAVLMLDLDKFKIINDTLGHGAGDQLLKCVGERLTGVTRKSDTVARIGGDEFVLVLPQISSPENAALLAQRILNSFREPFLFDGHEMNVTTSIGIAVYPEDGKEIDILLKNADNAMYLAKDQGRNTYKFHGSYAATAVAKARRNA
jgi:diguanylate cyclase (GGDEF)-like protein/PAS domain S-box-containing protein